MIKVTYSINWSSSVCFSGSRGYGVQYGQLFSACPFCVEQAGILDDSRDLSG